MADNISWSPVFPYVPTFIAFLFVLGTLLFLEWKRKLRFRVLRMIATVVAITTILLLTLRPALTIELSSKASLLLTPGYNNSSVDSLQTSISNLNTFASPGATSYAGSTQVSWNELASIPNLKFIAGSGLPSWALKTLGNKNFKYLAGSPVEGITRLEYPQSFIVNRLNKLTGSLRTNKSATSIALYGPGGREDSLRLEGPGNHEFALAFHPKAPGPIDYFVSTWLDGVETRQHLPLNILPERPLSILILSNFPVYEHRYLKTFLADRGHQVAVRNTISKDRFRTEFANRREVNLNTISQKLLSELDLLFIDDLAFSSLSKKEQNTVMQSVNYGLGIIYMPASGKVRNELFALEPGVGADTTRVSIEKEGEFGMPWINAKVITPATTILHSKNQQVVQTYRFHGAGKVGLQLLRETYRLGLSEKPDAYAGIWVKLIETVARPVRQDFKFSIVTPFPWYENQPLDVQIVSSGQIPHLSVDNIDVPLIEDPVIDDVWQGRVWLEQIQWHQFKIDSLTIPVHLSPDNEWQTLATENYKNATALVQESIDRTSTTLNEYDRTLPSLVLIIMFIVASGFIWLSPKL